MSEEDDDDAKNKNCWDEENLCPNKGRKARKKGGQKLLRSDGNATKASGERSTAVGLSAPDNVESVWSHQMLLSTEAQGTVGKGRPRTTVRTKGRQSNTPTQSREFSTVSV